MQKNTQKKVAAPVTLQRTFIDSCLAIPCTLESVNQSVWMSSYLCVVTYAGHDLLNTG